MEIVPFSSYKWLGFTHMLFRNGLNTALLRLIHVACVHFVVLSLPYTWREYYNVDYNFNRLIMKMFVCVCV